MAPIHLSDRERPARDRARRVPAHHSRRAARLASAGSTCRRRGCTGVLGLVQVEVEAAAGGTSAAELTLAAVTAQEGERLRQVLLSQQGDAQDADPDARTSARVLYRATPRLLVAGGLTSGRHILAPLAVLGVVVNFADDLPGALGERILGSAADRASTATRSASACSSQPSLLLALVLAAAGSLLTDWNFELKDEGDRLVAQRGLLTRRSVAIDRARVRGLDLLDSPLRRPFGLVGVRAIAGGIEGGRSGRAALAPVIASADAHALVRALDPLVDPEAPLERHPRAARTRRFVRALSAPAALVVVALAPELVVGGCRCARASRSRRRSARPRPLPSARPPLRRPQARRSRADRCSAGAASLDSRAVVSYLVRQSPMQAAGGSVLGRPPPRSGSGLATGARLLGGAGGRAARGARCAALRPVRRTRARRGAADVAQRDLPVCPITEAAVQNNELSR